MKSFKEYLAEQEQHLIVENEWNFNIPKTRMFETDQKNQTAAKNIIIQALKGKGNSFADAFVAIKTKAANGEEIKAGEKDVDDVLQALSVLSTIATKKNTPAYKMLTPLESKKFLEQAGVKAGADGSFKDNPAVNVGRKIITTKRKHPEPEVDGEEKPEVGTPAAGTPAAGTPAAGTPAVADGEEEEEEEEEDGEEEDGEEGEKPDTTPDTAGSSTATPDKEKSKSSDDTKKSKDVDLESENKRSPAFYSKRAEDLKNEYMDSLKSRKQELDPNKAGFIDKKSLAFEEKANNLIKDINKQQNNFSVHSTPASRLKATNISNVKYTELLRLKNQIEYETGKLDRTNVLQRAGTKMKEAGEGIARNVKKVTGSKAFQDTKDAMGRAIKKTAEVGGKAIVGAAEGASRVVKTVADSKTTQEIKAATGRVWDKVKTKASEADEAIASGKAWGNVKAKASEAAAKIADYNKLPQPKTNIEQKTAEVQQATAEEPKTAEVMKDKIENQPDNQVANAAQAKETSKLVMDKATMQKVLPGQGTPKAPLIAKKKKEEERDGEGNIIHKTKVV